MQADERAQIKRQNFIVINSSPDFVDVARDVGRTSVTT